MDEEAVAACFCCRFRRGAGGGGGGVGGFDELSAGRAGSRVFFMPSIATRPCLRVAAEAPPPLDTVTSSFGSAFPNSHSVRRGAMAARAIGLDISIGAVDGPRRSFDPEVLFDRVRCD